MFGGRENTGSASPWDNPSYYWVVICKNGRFHHHSNLLFGHKIPLGETDAVSPKPVTPRPFRVLCDECGREYEYDPKEVLRLGLTPPGCFTPHPLFSDGSNIKPPPAETTNTDPAADKSGRSRFGQLLSRLTRSLRAR